jgi:hypothetical protein
MTKSRSLLSSLLLTMCVLLAGACNADDDACADDTCERNEPDTATEPTTPEPQPVPCVPACQALTDSCGADQPGDATDVHMMAACIDWCEAGGLTADEGACLAATTCDSAAGCLAG